jgi:hypothetical protein
MIKATRWTNKAAVCLLLSVFALSAAAQTTPLKSTNLSGTIGSTGQFQSIQGQANNRQGCSIQNNGTHTMYVFFGPIANATVGASYVLGPGSSTAGGQSINCAVSGNSVLLDQVSITGTSCDSFTANVQ